MRRLHLAAAGIVLGCLLAFPAHATDVDGGNDCQRNNTDFGDAPEGVLAYPGVPGRFPTCTAAGPVGAQDLACAPISSIPGATGYVKHNSIVGSTPLFWLGCPSGPAPTGIDTEGDGKVNNSPVLGAPSACAPIPTDCVEAAFTLSFGQDECYGSTDAGVFAPTLTTCGTATVTFNTYSCTPNVPVYLNILIDYNQDGDWNDNFQCLGGCAYEWAVQNAKITLPPGCGTITTPPFRVGPNAGPAWMRVTLSFVPPNADFPWAGSATMAGGALTGGETEDYPVTINAGHDPCQSEYIDYGDAPEECQAYPGVGGHFPTCVFDTPPGTTELACPPISTPPGLTGYVAHLAAAGDPMHFWLGCGDPSIPHIGVDGEANGKVNNAAAAGSPSVCDPAVAVDCVEGAFTLTFGQDECYGDYDAGIVSPLTFTACSPSSVPFRATTCNQGFVYLNICVDWNQDGDWNDNFQCAGSCAYEWAVKNRPVMLTPGCNSYTSPTFTAGPLAAGATGQGWLRITLSQTPVPDDYPWNGSKGSGSPFRNGETEDYPVTIVPPAGPCELGFDDWGDAPEAIMAYPGALAVPGHFPTCFVMTAAGTQNLACAPISTAPAGTGFVHHLISALDPVSHFWLGCPSAATNTYGIDSETDGKVNNSPVVGDPSACSGIPTDCVETAFGGASFGQDECYGDLDAGVSSAPSFTTCQPGSLTFKTYNCTTQVLQATLNILVDMNQDGDWNDNFQCQGGCAYEWAVKNVPITLPPGCTTLTSPNFLIGPNAGHGWLRVTITAGPVFDDFPWNGSAGLMGQFFRGGETEDYPIEIQPPTQNPCEIGYRDFGDAPEGLAAYASGAAGHFPTCIFGSPPGTQEIECDPPQSTPPATTGYVQHVALPTDARHFWLGCGTGPGPGGVDSEANGKVNNSIVPGGPSICDAAVTTDCVEGTVDGLSFSQDECTGDGVDAGIGSPVMVGRCSTSVLTFKATNCGTTDIDVYVNVLCDWNQDGDWNDNILCDAKLVRCAHEWAVKNFVITLPVGCSTVTLPPFQVGPKEGPSWMRITLTEVPVQDDFPWNGSLGEPNGIYRGGETEDYPVAIGHSTVGVDERLTPQGVNLGVRPNPTNSDVNVSLTLARESRVTLAVYDIVGRKRATLAAGVLPAGERTIRWNFRSDDGEPLPTGLYLVRADIDGRRLTRTCVRIR